MYQFGNNLGHKKGGGITALKVSHFAIILIILSIVFALVTKLVFLSNRENNNDSKSSTTNTDKDFTASNQSLQQTPEGDTSIPSAMGTVITTGYSEFGTMLFNDKKQAIYIWELEESEKAQCYESCAEAWPPVLTEGVPQATGGVNGSLIGTTKRIDGNIQVTYNGHPLYYYAHEGPGEVKCHNVSTHGGLWWVIQPDGNRAN